jgi:hypothetical protein
LPQLLQNATGKYLVRILFFLPRFLLITHILKAAPHIRDLANKMRSACMQRDSQSHVGRSSVIDLIALVLRTALASKDTKTSADEKENNCKFTKEDSRRASALLQTLFDTDDIGASAAITARVLSVAKTRISPATTAALVSERLQVIVRRCGEEDASVGNVARAMMSFWFSVGDDLTSARVAVDGVVAMLLGMSEHAEVLRLVNQSLMRGQADLRVVAPVSMGSSMYMCA